MSRILKLFLLLLLSLALRGISFSTHLKAGEIVSQRINAYQYKFILTIYTDSTSVINFQVDEPTATLDFGDGTSQTVNRDAPGRISIGKNTFKNIYTFIHTYPGSGNYTVSYQRDNRNAGILNMDNSGYTPFYLESTVLISPFLGVNNSPVLLYPPIDEGVVGKKYVHNPGAFDPEGDSISYSLSTPKQSKGIDVNGYTNPNFAGGSFSLNPVTGDLVWNAPLIAGLYNVAFIIKEWRNGKVIGTIERDMQIRILPGDNNPPVLKIPNDTCIVALSNTTLIANAFAVDPDGDKIQMSAVGGPFSLNPAATVSPTGIQNSPAMLTFTWPLTCDLIRDQPYNLVFKAEDQPLQGQKLVDLKTWSIKILGPAPEGLIVDPINEGFQLSWNQYPCSKASKIEIFRKDCDSADVVVDSCQGGAPLGFKKVGDVPIGSTKYKDTSNINPGSFYCYIIVASFSSPKGGVSLPSEQQCVVANVGEPLPTNVSVLKTDSVNGKILVKWTQPFELNSTQFPGPYRYIVSRAKLPLSNFQPLDTFNNLADTIFIDSLINTAKDNFTYRVSFYYTKNGLYTLKSVSDNSSTVFLNAIPGGNQITVNWTYNTPWDNRDHYHRIYKEISPNTFSLIDSVLVTGMGGTFTATGLPNQDTACFYVETQGEYCRDGLPKPLLNKSQIVCAVPHDTLPPCPPALAGPTSCIEDGITQLKVLWTPDKSPSCNKDIKGYNVYHSDYEGEDMSLIASNVKDTFFIDFDNNSLAGCYAVTAMNFYGKESSQSNKVCVDICVYYELPNLITPNRDLKNDVFRPFPVPKNVKQVNFKVYNRWGERIFSMDNNINLDWPAVDSFGKPINSGIYFYETEVIFKRRLHKEDEIKILKGWVHVIQKENEIINE